MNPSTLFAVLSLLVLAACGTGYDTGQWNPAVDIGRSSDSGASLGYTPNYQGGEVTGSALDRTGQMVQ